MTHASIKSGHIRNQLLAEIGPLEAIRWAMTRTVTHSAVSGIVHIKPPGKPGMTILLTKVEHQVN